EIVDMVGKDKSSICRSVSVLAKKNLVITEPVSYKCIRVWLTDKAREIQPKVMQIAEERHEALLKLASQKDIEAFVRVLTAILK
ncbi:MAG: MarR family winged helix-turn-helix transcriptional regulator, partial [Muribaculaceae bacterium]|nr:MarR family winged helix-turn-helix transcriptional regulator [Muribaculaceae bacterium]